MPKLKIELDLPEGVDFIRLAFSKDGWEAACCAWASEDRWGVVIPSQMGYAFKGKTPEAAIKEAASMAVFHRNKIKQQRNNRPDPNAPNVSEADSLAKLLGLD